MPTNLRLGLYYCAIFIGTGASLPYMPVWFRAQGLSGAEIGIILAAPSLARIVISPMAAVWADGFRLRRTPLVILGTVAALAYGVVGLVHGFTAWLLAWTIGMAMLGTLPSLADVMGLRLSRREGFSYPFARGLGSIAFIVGNLAVGALLAVVTPDLVLFWTISAAALAAIFAGVLLPPEPVHEGGEAPPRTSRWRGLSDLLRNRLFMLAVVGAGVIQASHGFYYAFSALLWRRQEIGEAWIGALWAIGVILEVAFMWFAEGWRRRVRPEVMVAIGGVAALIRWSALAFSPPLWLLFPLQGLHSLSFTATFLGSLALIERYAPPHTASAAQTISSSLAGGLFIGLATLGSGPLFDAFGPFGYLGMTVMTLIGMAVIGLVIRETGRGNLSNSS
ncbi:MFS transporter [Caulobacter sp. NIBR1757]|uniref:MFS transporter n=1 Tax=Caulobacter sp. NIBR1757 TaxID=3016000 RepID=UPI0022F0F0F4|nr:MFS transporter [Caulobacter sp. NIBR1757]WGM38934.1 putative 3-phenylpropionic acid transporter [Caulobacter sp. NIBR1757]